MQKLRSLERNTSSSCTYAASYARSYYSLVYLSNLIVSPAARCPIRSFAARPRSIRPRMFDSRAHETHASAPYTRVSALLQLRPSNVSQCDVVNERVNSGVSRTEQTRHEWCSLVLLEASPSPCERIALSHHDRCLPALNTSSYDLTSHALLET